MLHIARQTANQAWFETLQTLAAQGERTGNDKYFRDEVVLVEIDTPNVEPADPRFPMLQAEIDVITDYLVTGNNEDKVTHEWTKLYRHRSFDEPHSQIKFLISRLSEKNPVGEAQISIWDKVVDQNQPVQPCTQIIWARIKHGQLELHVHTNASDAYKKLLMNLLEFIALQHYIADQVGLPAGKHYHFIDSCHIYMKDQTAVEQLLTAE